MCQPIADVTLLRIALWAHCGIYLNNELPICSTLIRDLLLGLPTSSSPRPSARVDREVTARDSIPTRLLQSRRRRQFFEQLVHNAAAGLNFALVLENISLQVHSTPAVLAPSSVQIKVLSHAW